MSKLYVSFAAAIPPAISTSSPTTIKYSYLVIITRIRVQHPSYYPSPYAAFLTGYASIHPESLPFVRRSQTPVYLCRIFAVYEHSASKSHLTILLSTTSNPPKHLTIIYC